MAGLRRRLIPGTVLMALLAIALPVLAHHGTAAFDTGSMVTVTGTVTEFQYVNPHVQIYFEVKGDKGEAEAWQGELTAPNKLNRAGWSKNTLKPGDSITVTGNPGKNAPHTLWIRKLIGPSDESLQLFED
jgi:predicted dehydrogenase